MAYVERSDDAENPRRRERAAIAAQACQTCRTRKSKCDESRPKCGLCERLGLDCQYREPLPTKKDKTMVQILETLNRLETKFDNIQPQQSLGANDTMPARASSTPMGVKPLSAALHGDNIEPLTANHRVFLWPAIYLHLLSTSIPAVSDLQYVIQNGSAWLVDHEAGRPIPLDATCSLATAPVIRDNKKSHSRVTFGDLNIQRVQSCSEAYFNTFNVLNPLLDAELFTNEIVSPLLRDGYGYGDVQSVLALLVFALGQLALQGTLDKPISYNEDGRPSGIRGGSIASPPGLDIFNEARRRIAFVGSENSIEVCQCYLLQATYYAANAMHVEFWKSSIAASTTCQALLRRGDIDWSLPETEALKRVYWVCQLNESICRLELCLPSTGLQDLQGSVPLPLHGNGSNANAWSGDANRPQHEYYFNAICNLEKLIAEIHASIIEPAAEQSTSTLPFHGPSMPLVRDMARQLESWRSLLPRQLHWLDNEMYNFPNTDHTNRAPSDALFVLDQGTIPIRHRYNLDVATAWLRSRYYYAKYLMYQPFIYKALHFPELLSKDDADCAAMAIRAACGWPIAMAPPKDKKRLIPMLFSWTQAFMSVLLIFEMARNNVTLRSICDEQVDPQQIQQTILLLLDWLDDIRQYDGAAAWGWQILHPLFQR